MKTVCTTYTAYTVEIVEQKKIFKNKTNFFWRRCNSVNDWKKTAEEDISLFKKIFMMRPNEIKWWWLWWLDWWIDSHLVNHHHRMDVNISCCYLIMLADVFLLLLFCFFVKRTNHSFKISIDSLFGCHCSRCRCRRRNIKLKHIYTAKQENDSMKIWNWTIFLYILVRILLTGWQQQQQKKNKKNKMKIITDKKKNI